MKRTRPSLLPYQLVTLRGPDPEYYCCYLIAPKTPEGASIVDVLTTLDAKNRERDWWRIWRVVSSVVDSEERRYTTPSTPPCEIGRHSSSEEEEEEEETEANPPAGPTPREKADLETFRSYFLCNVPIGDMVTVESVDMRHSARLPILVPIDASYVFEVDPS